MSRLAKHAVIALLGGLLGVSTAASAEPVIRHQQMAEKLLGKHALTLQWLGFGDLRQAGTVEVVKDDGGNWRLTGRQETADGMMEIDGTILEIDRATFKFQGRIVTQVSHIAAGKACLRDGEFIFLKRGARKYWRLQQMDNPCDTATDYVDIYLR